MGILEGTWVVFLDKQGKWHCYESGYPDKEGYCDENARTLAKLLVGQSSGTSSLINTAVVAYCIHAKNRYQAVKMAKVAHKRILLDTPPNLVVK